MVSRRLRAAGRWFSPTILVLALLCFVLPFATVSCDTPGGYGRAAPGGTTTYNGIDLAVGGRPDVTPPEKVLPVAQQREDRLPAQPAAIVVLILIVAATGFAIATSERRSRRASVAVLAAVAATALLVNQALVQAELALRVGDQLTAAPPPGKTVRDYVHTGAGFVLCLLLLLLALVVNAVGWWQARPRAALVSTEDLR